MSLKLSDDSASLCEEIAEETRAELGLGDRARVEPGALAELLGIDVVEIAEFEDRCVCEVAQLTEDDPTALSAVLLSGNSVQGSREPQPPPPPSRRIHSP